jgi:DNA-binding phage protein
MKQRCSNPKAQKFADYGGRGIRVCARWATFDAFIADVGPRPSPRHSLGRKDNDGNYEPGNVRWETLEEQRGNSRQNHVIEAFGRKQILVAWARETGLSVETIRKRLRLSWSPEKALSTPVLVHVPKPIGEIVKRAGFAGVADFIRRTGTSASTLYRFANGEQEPSVQLAKLLRL